MYRGETITTVITGFPIPVSEIKTLCIVFKNGFRTLLEKSLEDCTASEGNSLTFKLTQEESLLLSKGIITRSVVGLTKDGCRFESLSSPFMCRETVKDEVLT